MKERGSDQGRRAEAMQLRRDGSVLVVLHDLSGWVAVVRVVMRSGVLAVSELAVMSEDEYRRRDRGEGLPANTPATFERWAARAAGMLTDPGELPGEGLTGRLLRSFGVGALRTALLAAITGLTAAHPDRPASPVLRALVPPAPGSGKRGKRAKRTDDQIASAALRWLHLATLSPPDGGPRRALAEHVKHLVADGDVPNTKAARRRAYERFKQDVGAARASERGYLPPAPSRGNPGLPAITPQLRAWAKRAGREQELATVEERIAPRGRSGKG